MLRVSLSPSSLTCRRCVRSPPRKPALAGGIACMALTGSAQRRSTPRAETVKPVKPREMFPIGRIFLLYCRKKLGGRGVGENDSTGPLTRRGKRVKVCVLLAGFAGLSLADWRMTAWLACVAMVWRVCWVRQEGVRRRAASHCGAPHGVCRVEAGVSAWLRAPGAAF